MSIGDLEVDLADAVKKSSVANTVELTSDGSFARIKTSCALYLAALSVPLPLDAKVLLEEGVDVVGVGCRVGAGRTEGLPASDIGSVSVWMVLCVGEDVVAGAGADGRWVRLLGRNAKMIGHGEKV